MSAKAACKNVDGVGMDWADVGVWVEWRILGIEIHPGDGRQQLAAAVDA